MGGIVGDKLLPLHGNVGFNLLAADAVTVGLALNIEFRHL